MNDLERDLRELLERAAEDARPTPSERVPESVRHRARRRATRTVAVGLLSLVALAGAGIIGTQAFRHRATGIRPADGPPSGGTTMLPDGRPAFLLHNGDTWQFVAYRRVPHSSRAHASEETSSSQSESGDVCLAIIEGGESSACRFLVPDPQSIELSAVRSGSGALVFGAVSFEADRVRVGSDSGASRDATIIRLPEELDARFDAFVVDLGPGTADFGSAEALDAAGVSLGSSEWVAEPAPEGRPIGVLDTFGNFVGEVPYEDVFAPPPQETSWAPPGAPTSIREIRAIARIDHLDVIPKLRRWWNSRPKPEESDASFKAWWDAYPIRSAIPEPAGG